MSKVRTVFTMGTFAAFALIGLSGAANAASSKESEYTHSACEGQGAICGAVVMINGTSATLDWVSLKARGSQPYDDYMHPKCPTVTKKFDRDTPSGNYDVFVVPASCAYKIEMKIHSGDKKDLNLYLTPGCSIKAQVSGSASSTKWKTLDINTLSDAVPTDKNGKPINSGGYKCGKQSGADNAQLS
ncbi:MAG: hypothetical protein AAGA72_13420 [Pseudomonadota bacterium]